MKVSEGKNGKSIIIEMPVLDEKEVVATEKGNKTIINSRGAQPVSFKSKILKLNITGYIKV